MSAEFAICDGRQFFGLVRKPRYGRFVLVVDEQIVGSYPTRNQATEALLDLARAGGTQ